MDTELVLRIIALAMGFLAIFFSSCSLYISIVRYKKLKNDYTNMSKKLEKLKGGY